MPTSYPRLRRALLRGCAAAAALAAALVPAACGREPTAAPEPSATRVVYGPLLLDGGDGTAYHLSRTPSAHASSAQRAAQRTAALASSSPAMSFDGFWRLSAETQQRIEVLDGGDAYFRDPSIEIDNTLNAAADGDTWRIDIVHPSGALETGVTVTFHSDYNGEKDCFVFGSSYLCGGQWAWFWTELTTQCAEEGIYTAKMFYDGSLVQSPTFKLRPIVAPGSTSNLFQLDYPDDSYDNACKSGTGSITCTGAPGEVKRTIKQKGCGLTAAAMMLGYHGVSVDPKTLNDWMTTNGAFEPGGNLGWPGFVSYAATKDSTLRFDERGPGTFADLHTRICRYGPQIIEVKSLGSSAQHFVLATGFSDDMKTVKINDPASRTNTDLTPYGNSFRSSRLFSGPLRTDTLAADIIITFHSPGHLVLTDALGNRVGYDPARGVAYNEIPGAYYDTLVALSTVVDDGVFDDDEHDPAKEIHVPGAAAGHYTVDVTGTGDGTYILTMAGYGARMRSSRAEFWGVPITSGEVHSYSFDYDPATAGSGTPLAISGAFSGGGQKKVVDELLSYSRPASRQTQLPAGTTSYAVMIFYGSGLNSSSFQAVLNGVDITSSFHPAPGTSENVTIPLVSGRNVVKLSASGTVGSRSSSDADQLVLKVP